MSNLNKSGKSKATTGNGPVDSPSEREQAAEAFRDYSENERFLLQVRAKRALKDVEKLLNQESSGNRKRSEIEVAMDHLEQVVECMADESLICISAEALETEDWLQYDAFRYQYSVSRKMPMLLAAFVVLVENGVTPGRWILDPLAKAFYSILEERDPLLVARILGLQGKGSGSSSPLQDFTRQLEGGQINLNMKTLMEEFGISQLNAANAVKEKFGLKDSPKTLVNRYESRSKFPDLVRTALNKHSDELNEFSTCWLTEHANRDFLNSFPESAQKYLKPKCP